MRQPEGRATVLIPLRSVHEFPEAIISCMSTNKGHSMKQEALLKRKLVSEGAARVHLVDAIRRRIQPLGGVDLPVIPRGPIQKSN